MNEVTAEAVDLLTDGHRRMKPIMTSMAEAAANMEEAMARIRRAPWMMLYQPSREELVWANLLDARESLARRTYQLAQLAEELEQGVESSEARQKLLELIETQKQALEELDAKIQDILTRAR